jgi:hypothetical protein
MHAKLDVAVRITFGSLMATLHDYHALRAQEEQAWRQRPPAAALARRDPSALRRLRRLLRGMVSYSGRHAVDFLPGRRNQADIAAAELCAAYRQARALERAFLRSQVGGARAWALLTFSKRAAVDALNTGAVEPLRNALAAHALEDLAWGDVRDNLVALGLIYHCARSIGAGPRKLFREAAGIAGPCMARVLREFVRRKDLANIVRAMGFRRVRVEGGVGFCW